jgi:hypothetical protein
VVLAKTGDHPQRRFSQILNEFENLKNPFLYFGYLLEPIVEIRQPLYIFEVTSNLFLIVGLTE